LQYWGLTSRSWYRTFH